MLIASAVYPDEVVVQSLHCLHSGILHLAIANLPKIAKRHVCSVRNRLQFGVWDGAETGQHSVEKLKFAHRFGF